MSLFSFSKKPDKNGVVAIFDIGSASVGGALVFLDEGKIPKVLYSVRKEMVFKEDLDINKFTSSMIRTLESVLADIEKKGLIHLNFRTLKNKEITNAFCFFSSPWYVSQTNVVRINKKELFSVNQDLVDEIIGEERRLFMEEKGKIFGRGNEVEFMESKIIQLRLNGYKIQNPYKKYVNSVEAEVFLSLIMTNVADKVEKTVAKYFNLERLHMHSFTLASFLCLRDIFESNDDFVFLDVSGEVTDVSFIKNDSLRETETFPMGKNAFIREIMKDLKTNYSSASSMINIYKEGKMDPENSKKIEGSINKIKKVWIKYLEQAMFDLSHGAILPRVIFVIADPDVGDVLIKMIQQENFTKLVFPDYNQSAEPLFIKPNLLKNSCDFYSDVEKDVFLMMESAFISRISDS